MLRLSLTIILSIENISHGPGPISGPGNINNQQDHVSAYMELNIQFTTSKALI